MNQALCATAIIVTLLAAAAWAQDGPVGVDADRWINVADLGASGSEAQTTAKTTEGSNQIVVADPGDFQVGQGVMVSRANVRYTDTLMWGPTMGKRHEPTAEEVELRGYDGSSGSWTVFVVEVAPSDPPTFRWTDDLALNWHDGGEVSADWQPLSGGTEIKINKRDWEGAGHLITFSARDQLISVIEKIEGNVITLKDPANRSVEDAVVRHNDTEALQAALDRAVAEGRNVYFPVGHYMLVTGLTVTNPTAIVIQGESPVGTVLDISEGTGSCLRLVNGQEVALRNLRFVGHSGVDVRRQMGSIRTNTPQHLWGFYLKHCNAVGISNTTRVLCDNCHATKMSAECFYSAGRARKIDSEPAQYTKEITYYRCSVENCSRNAFNNNDLAENTSVLQCRIRDVGGCTWEGASRFVRFIGNYVRNGGTVAMGNIRSRGEYLEQLGTGQHIVADNVFETGMIYGSAAVRLASGGTQTIVRNNLFINYGTSGIEISGQGPTTSLPSRWGTITGNIMDMTDVEAQGLARYGISVSASDVIVSDNQIYVRGQCDPNVTAIKLSEPMVNLQIHGNQITNCGAGIKLSRGRASVGEVTGERSFVTTAASIPLERRQSHRYRGWGMAWFSGANLQGASVVEDFDPDTLQFTLAEPRELKVGQSYEVFPTSGVNWSISRNTISSCQQPVMLDSWGSGTSTISDNLITRGDLPGVQAALDITGQFKLIGNRIVGFNEEGSSALTLRPDPGNRPVRSVFLRNIFERCANVVAETAPGLWAGSLAADNTFIDCGGVPDSGAAPQAQMQVTPILVTPPPPPVMVAGAPPAGLKIDGDVSEWPFDDPDRAVALAQTPDGRPVRSGKAELCVARDADSLYLAARIPLGEGVEPVKMAGGWAGDGIEVSFRDADPKSSSPIFVNWGSAGGTLEGSTAGGASPEQMSAMRDAITYAAAAGPGQWSCEWRIPLRAIAADPGKLKRLLFNVGVHHERGGDWVAWVGTGGPIYQVGSAGELVLGE